MLWPKADCLLFGAIVENTDALRHLRLLSRRSRHSRRASHNGKLAGGSDAPETQMSRERWPFARSPDPSLPVPLSHQGLPGGHASPALCLLFLLSCVLRLHPLSHRLKLSLHLEQPRLTKPPEDRRVLDVGCETRGLAYVPAERWPLPPAVAGCGNAESHLANARAVNPEPGRICFEPGGACALPSKSAPDRRGGQSLTDPIRAGPASSCASRRTSCGGDTCRPQPIGHDGDGDEQGEPAEVHPRLHSGASVSALD